VESKAWEIKRQWVVVKYRNSFYTLSMAVSVSDWR
jgi:hypothetical protein